MLLAVAFLHAIAAMAKPSHPVRAPRVSHFADPTVSISQFGAIENIDTIEAATANANAFSMAIHNTSGTGGTVLVPNGTFTMLGHEGAVGISSISIHIIGVISAWANATQWPNDGHKAYYPLIGMSNCSDIRISGPGTIEGNGYLWWWAEILPPFLPYHRPTLVELYSCERVAIGGGLTTRNAPNFNFNMRGMLDLEVSHVTVDTDVFGLATGLRERGALAPLTGEHGKPWHHGMTSDARIALQRRASAVHPLGFDIPTFPLNTDGFDLAGQNIYIHDCNVTNFDDAIAVKPTGKTGNNPFGISCTGNLTAENMHVTYGVGMSIGSVPPEPTDNCVDGVVFRNITFAAPLKTVYVKSNEGRNGGTGLIQNVRYEGIRATDAIWWPIYVGPQQQLQPDGGGEGWWPNTVPEVTIRNVSIVDMVATGCLWGRAGALRGNVSNPHTHIDMTNVRVTGWNASMDWVCEHTSGVATNVIPRPGCY